MQLIADQHVALKRKDFLRRKRYKRDISEANTRTSCVSIISSDAHFDDQDSATPKYQFSLTMTNRTDKNKRSSESKRLQKPSLDISRCRSKRIRSIDLKNETEWTPKSSRSTRILSGKSKASPKASNPRARMTKSGNEDILDGFDGDDSEFEGDAICSRVAQPAAIFNGKPKYHDKMTRRQAQMEIDEDQDDEDYGDDDNDVTFVAGEDNYDEYNDSVGRDADESDSDVGADMLSRSIRLQRANMKRNGEFDEGAHFVTAEAGSALDERVQDKAERRQRLLYI